MAIKQKIIFLPVLMSFLTLLLSSKTSVATYRSSHFVTNPVVHKASTTAPEQSQFILLSNGRDSFAMRRAIADLAESTIDAQYYIWHNDTSGAALLSHLLKAVERGVKVRLLLDDIKMAGMKSILRSIDAHPLIEVRLFNPINTEGGFLPNIKRGIEFFFEFYRMNHRMHNKVFLVDNKAAIVGGRNIGDEYFDLDHLSNFRDLDVLASGPVVRDIAFAFEEYWNSSLAYPIQDIYKPRTKNDFEKEWTNISQKLLDKGEELEDPAFNPYTDFMSATEISSHFSKATFYGDAKVVYDLPEKYRGKSEERLSAKLGAISTAKSEILIESAYFIPSKDLIAALHELELRGVDVKILTNSMESNDVLAAHAGYSAKRKAVLNSGVNLYEWRSDSKAQKSSFVIDLYASRPSLHTKVFVIDRRFIFIGSFNIDPRSIHLNTEIGILIDDPSMAENVAEFIETGMSGENSWQLLLNCTKSSCREDEFVLEWRGNRNGEFIRFDKEPDSNAWQRFLSYFLSILPLDHLL